MFVELYFWYPNKHSVHSGIENGFKVTEPLNIRVPNGTEK